MERGTPWIEELHYRDGRVEAEFLGPVQLKVYADEHSENDVFDFSLESKLTGHLRKVSFTFSRPELDQFINDLVRLREDLDRRNREQLERSKVDWEAFEVWKKEREP